jgi:glyoxylase-like metal-dependent hydrolase (beta-lactamase superfamily II)
MKKETLVRSATLELLRMVVGPFDNNVYLLRDPTASCCALIDAAAEPARIQEAIGDDRLLAILQTHTHMDHIQGLESLRRKTGAPVGIHPLEPEAQGLHPELSLSEGDRIAVGANQLEVLHTPGHTPGSVCFLLRGRLCFCGDTIFPGGPGKTWSPEAFLQIIQSLEQRIYPLPEEVRLLPGHGEEITVGASRREYEAFRSRPREGIPWGDVLWDAS